MVASLFETFFGNMAVSFGRMTAAVMGIPLPSKQVNYTKGF
jgi:hypothetical protein